MKKRKIIITAITVFILILGGGWFWWVSDYYKADTAFSQITGTETLAIKVNSLQIEFYPNNTKVNTGLIIYPGAKVDFQAYAPTAKAIAEKGYKVVIVKMPQNLAIFGANKAGKIIKENPEIENWALAGHSLGGVIGSQYAAKNTDIVKGIVFWASYPSKDISNTKLKTLTLYGSKDGLITEKKIQDTRKLLPKDSETDEIQGGNHCNFGYYGFQKGDSEASITKEEQQKIIVEKTSEFLSALKK